MTLHHSRLSNNRLLYSPASSGECPCFRIRHIRVLSWWSIGLDYGPWREWGLLDTAKVSGMAGIRRQEVKNFMIIPRVDQHLLIGRCISTWSCIANAVSGRAERLKCWIKRSFTFFSIKSACFWPERELRSVHYTAASRHVSVFEGGYTTELINQDEKVVTSYTWIRSNGREVVGLAHCVFNNRRPYLANRRMINCVFWVSLYFGSGLWGIVREMRGAMTQTPTLIIPSPLLMKWRSLMLHMGEVVGTSYIYHKGIHLRWSSSTRLWQDRLPLQFVLAWIRIRWCISVQSVSISKRLAPSTICHPVSSFQ